MQIYLKNKVLKKLEQEWNTFSSNKSYVFPRTNEDYKKQFNRKTLTIEVDSTYRFLHQDLERRFQKFVDEIASSPFSNCKGETYILRSRVSYGEVYKIIVHELQLEIKSRERDRSNKRTFSTVRESIQDTIDEKVSVFDFFFTLKGIKIENSITLDFKHLELFVFEQRDCASLMVNYLREKERDYKFRDSKNRMYCHVPDFIDEVLLGHTCVRACAYGDLETAEKIAYKQTKETINYLRYIVCLIYHKRIAENLLKISFSFEAYSERKNTLSMRNKGNDITLSYGRGRGRRQELVIDENFLKDMNSKAFLDDFIEIANSHEHTQVEGMYFNGNLLDRRGARRI